jgi:hypothetical protein
MSFLPEVHSPHILAQKLNEHAAFCIEVGYYERAIPVLVEALHLAEEAHNNIEEDNCRCEDCSLESCMIFGQISLPQCATPTKKCQSLSDESEDTFVYRQPIRLTPQSTQEGHNMASTLTMIITFNLALAYHLTAIEKGWINRDSLQKVLQLYELAYRWQLLEDDQGNAQVNSLSFTMILANNLGEIHRAVGNHTKYILCLQHLLSTAMMVVVDCNDREEESAIQMDIFFRNTSQLILHDQCAAAA